MGTGRVREKGKNKTDWIRQFNRCFVVVPQGSGFCIINETFFVSIAAKLASDTSLASSRMVDKETPADKAVKQRVGTEFSKGLGKDVLVHSVSRNNAAWITRSMIEGSRRNL